MSSKAKKWREVVKVRAERTNLLIRLPRWFIDEQDIKQGVYIVSDRQKDGSITLNTLERVCNGKR